MAIFLVDLTSVKTGERRSFVFDAAWSEDIKHGFEVGDFSKNQWREFAWQCAAGIPNTVALRNAKKIDNDQLRLYTVSIVDKRIKENDGILYQDQEFAHGG